MKHNWEYKRLGDVCSSKKEIGRACNYFGKDDEISYFDISSIDSKTNKATKFTTTSFGDAPSRAQQVIENGDVLYSLVRPNLKNIALLNSEVPNKVGSSGFCVLRGQDVRPQYILHFVLSSRFTEYILAKTSGASYPAVTECDVRNAPIPVPPMEVQDRIVAELDGINAQIDRCHELIRTLDSLSTALFYDTFGDPITNLKGWKVRKMGEVFEIGSGGTPSKEIAEYWNTNDIPWIGSNMCQNRVLYNTDGKYITHLGLENSSAKTLDIGTVLVALVGATIGKVAILKIQTTTNQNIGFIKPNRNVANPMFVFYEIQALYELFLGIGNGKFRMANLSFIRNLPLILPPLSLQEQFASQIEAIEAQKAKAEAAIAELQTLLDSRMDYWFN